MLGCQELVTKFPIQLVLPSEKDNLPELSQLTVLLSSSQHLALSPEAECLHLASPGEAPGGFMWSQGWLGCRWPAVPLGSSLSRGYESIQASCPGAGSWLLVPGSAEQGLETVPVLRRTCPSKFSKQITWIISN